MKKKVIGTLIAIVSILIIMLSIFLWKSGSKTSREDEVIEFLGGIKAYESDITIEVVNDRGKNLYKGVQVYKKDMGYKLQLEDSRIFLFRGDDITVKDKESTKTYTLEKEFDEVFKYGFIGEYIGLVYTNEELQFDEDTIDNEKCCVITTLIPGSNNNLYKGSMYYGIESHEPKKVIIYDNSNKERIIYTYENFNFMKEIADEEFDFD